ncbi:hypothetical protein PanWU01x14_281600 [Parasponia andersonii]|uniref:Uncharacterized protein n=1 Tax=Parasponia andersonii TaxID=3476 RepID=A0A2P5B132_PARAD|nr:hypothetical protein PanWU01x14_281600 [Parasponia andersonii]
MIDWQPYKKLRDNYVLVELSPYLAFCNSKTYFIYFNKISVYYPDLTLKQFGVESEDVVAAFPDLLVSKKNDNAGMSSTGVTVTIRSLSLCHEKEEKMHASYR